MNGQRETRWTGRSQLSSATSPPLSGCTSRAPPSPADAWSRLCVTQRSGQPSALPARARASGVPPAQTREPNALRSRACHSAVEARLTRALRAAPRRASDVQVARLWHAEQLAPDRARRPHGPECAVCRTASHLGGRARPLPPRPVSCPHPSPARTFGVRLGSRALSASPARALTSIWRAARAKACGRRAPFGRAPFCRRDCAHRRASHLRSPRGPICPS